MPVKVVSSDRLTTTLDVSATKSITSIPLKSKAGNRVDGHVPLPTPKTASAAATRTSKVKLVEAVDEGKGSEAGVRNILVVDDVSSNRKLLLMLLKKAGNMSLDSAACGEEAIEKFKNEPNRFDIILMDNVMPDMSGLEASKILRENGYKNLLIGVTGNAMDADLEEFVQAGADMAVAKPIKFDTLVSILGHCEQFGFASPNETGGDPDFNDRSRESMRALSRTL